MNLQALLTSWRRAKSNLSANLSRSMGWGADGDVLVSGSSDSGNLGPEVARVVGVEGLLPIAQKPRLSLEAMVQAQVIDATLVSV